MSIIDFILKPPVPVSIRKADAADPGNPLVEQFTEIGAELGLTESEAIITFDGTLSERHDFGNDMTDHAVEDGSPITDHIRPKPRMYNFTGVISDTSSLPGILGAVAGGLGGITSMIPGQESRTQEKFNTIKEVLASGKLFTMVTKYDVYKNAQFVSSPITRDDSGGAFKLQGTIKALKIVQSQAALIEADPRGGRGSLGAANAATDLGRQGATAATEAASGAGQTILDSIASGLF